MTQPRMCAIESGSVTLPFDPCEVADNLRLENYAGGPRIRLCPR